MVKRLAVTVHRWLGVVLAAFVVLAGLTGSLLAFHHEIDALLVPGLHRVQPRGSLAALDPVTAEIERRSTGLVVGYLVFTAGVPEASVRAVMNTRVAALAGKLDREAAHHTEYYIDPYSGAILGSRRWGELGLSPSHWVPMLYRLHMSLFAGELGQWITGGVAVILMVSIILGLGVIVARPRLLRSTFRPKLRSGGPRAFFDLHRSVGVVAGLPLLVIAFTGLYMNLPSVIEPLVRKVSSFSERPAAVRSPTTPREELWTLGWDEARRRAEAAVPNSPLAVMGRVESRGYYQARFMTADDIVDAGTTRVFVHGRTGEIVGRFEDRKGSAADMIRIWQFPLHSGQAFGLPGRILVLVLGLVPVLLAFTGVWLWLRRRRLSTAKRVTGAEPA